MKFFEEIKKPSTLASYKKKAAVAKFIKESSNAAWRAGYERGLKYYRQGPTNPYKAGTEDFKDYADGYHNGELDSHEKYGSSMDESVAMKGLNEFSPGGAEGAGPYAYGIALKEMAKLYAEGEFDLVHTGGMDTTSQNQSDAEEINSVADAFMNRGMDAGREAYNMVDTMVQEDMDEYLDGQGFNVDADIHAAYQNDVARYNASPEGQAGIAAHEARREAWRRSKPANQVIIQAIDPKGNLPIDNTRVVFDAREFNLEPGFLKYSIEQDIKQIKKTAPGSLIQLTLAGQPTDVQSILDQYKQLSKGPHDVSESYPKHQDLSGVSTEKLKAYLAKQSQQQVSGEGNQVKRVRAELQSRSQGVTEVSKDTLDRYVTKAVDAHGHADFSARMSKDDPTKRSYHVDQKKTAEKRRQGISRALDRMSKTEGVTENTKQEILFYAKLPDGSKVYARVKDEEQWADLQQKYRGAEIKTFDYNRPDVLDWLEARRINLRKFTPGMVQTMYPGSTGLNEFAPPGSSDGGDDGFSEDTLKQLAAQWYNGDEDPRVEKTLMAAGWEIGQDEGYDNGGAFVVQAGDINGDSYLSWPAEELEGLAEASLAQMRDYFNQPDGNTIAVNNQYGAPERKTQTIVPPEIQNLINKMYRVGKITPQEFATLKQFQQKTKLNVGIREADMTTGNQGYDSMLAVMKAVEAGHDATFNLGGEPITLDYNEARFLAGKYKAFLKAGRQEEFLKYMESPMAFDRLMKQLRDLMDKQRNFRGSVQGERSVAEGADPESAKFGKYIKKYFGQIYEYGDDGLNYLDNNAPFWASLFDKHDGDIDYIIDMEPADVLKQAALELKDVAGDLKYELDEQGVAARGAKDRQWSNKDMEKLRRAETEFDDILSGGRPDKTKQDLTKKRIQTKPMAGPKGVLPEQGVAEGVAETLSMDEAKKVLRQYGADNFKTTSNELHFYKNGKPFSVGLTLGDDGIRHVSLSSLNSATRKLKGQGVEEGIVDAIKTGTKKAFKALTGPDDEELIQRLEKETGGKRPEKKDSLPAVKENEYWCKLDCAAKLIPEGYKKLSSGYITRI
jgi:hypothetical protein